MTEACINGGCTREGKPCPVCGGVVPPSLGVKPRKFCSKKCCHESHRPRVAGRSSCADCGSPIEQPRGKGRKRVVCRQCKSTRKRSTHAAFCESCGRPFLSSSVSAKFCSVGCRWQNRVSDVNCAGCGELFRQQRPGQTCCSRMCGNAVGQRRRRAKTRKYCRCLHCGVPFVKRYRIRTANKYCSRQCAFDAKRLRAGSDPVGMLVAWFFSWGEDARPAVGEGIQQGSSHRARCLRHGVPYSPIDRESVFAAAGWKCAICGVEMLRRYTLHENRVDPRSPTVDCIIPIAAGPGSPGYVYGNVQACCHACNVRKSDSFVPQHPTSLD